jgi:acid stress-induced BolA-like protein IbaG/YrbA
MNDQIIKEMIETRLAAAKVTVSGDGYHYQVIVVSPDFENQSRVKRHQLIYSLFDTEIRQGHLHALTIKTYTPSEWESQA